MVFRAMIGAVLLLTPGCPPGVTAENRPAARVEQQLEEYQEVAYLTPAQKAQLAQLENETVAAQGAFGFVGWPKAKTPYRINLKVASGLPPEASLSQHATAFVDRIRPLWNLSDQPLQLIETVASADCSKAIFELTHGGVPVFNARLQVTLTLAGTIRAVAGFATKLEGDVSPPRSDATVAEALATGSFGSPGSPMPVVFDPFYTTGLEHAAEHAWLFKGSDPSPSAPAQLIVGDSPARPYFQGPGFPNATHSTLPGVCPDDDLTEWVGEVVLDPLTTTPAYAGFAHFGGLRVAGTTPVERAYAFLELEQVTKYWGDYSPRTHLRNPVVQELAGGDYQVTMTEVVSGVPVDGAYLTVGFNSFNKVIYAFARFLHHPIFSETPDIAAPAALDAALVWHVAQACQGYPAECPSIYKDFVAQHSTDGELVVFSSRIWENLDGTVGPDRLAYKFVFPIAVVYWDAKSNTPLRSIRRVADLAPFEVRGSTPTPVPPPCQTCPLTPPTTDWTRYPLEATHMGILPTAVDPDTPALFDALTVLDGFFRGNFSNLAPGSTTPVPHAGVDGIGMTILVARTGLTTNNARYVVPPDTGTPPTVVEVHFDTRVLSNQAVAHEAMHAVIELNPSRSTRTMYGMEGGALNESYADFFAVAAFPSQGANWDFAFQENFRGTGVPGRVRNLARPWETRLPFLPQVAFYADRWTICSPYATGDGCAHSWNGVPSRAATLMVGGYAPWFQREQLATLLYRTLRDRLQSSDRFVNNRLKQEIECSRSVDRAVLLGYGSNRGFITAEHCGRIRAAYNAVGVRAAVTSGYDRFPTGFEKAQDTITLYGGQFLRPGCSLTDHVMTVRVQPADSPTGTAQGFTIEQVSRTSSSPRLTVSVGPAADPELRAFVTSRGADTNPTDRTITYTFQKKWMDYRALLHFEEVILPPVGLGTLDCLSPPGTELEVLWGNEVAYWHFFGTGPQLDFVASGAVSPCEVLAVEGVHWHGPIGLGGPLGFQGAVWPWGPVTEPPLPGYEHGNHGFRVTRISPPTLNRFALDALVTSWHHIGATIHSRVAYTVAKPFFMPLTGCETPGVTTRAPLQQPGFP